MSMSLPLPTRSKRVLIAEDDAVTRALVTRLVQSEGYDPVICIDGREAVRTLKVDANFCGAIFDSSMPHLEGIAIIQFMHTEKRLMRIPIMMISGLQDSRLISNSFAAGVSLFLPKPFSAEKFQSTFRLLLAHNATLSRRQDSSQ